MRTFSEIKSTIEAGLGTQPCDLKLADVRLVNVFSSEICRTDIYIKDGRIVSIDPAAGLEAREVVDCRGQYAVPGLIDTHMIIGFGGAYLSLGQLSFFTENMTDGRGYIALAAVIFGRYTAIGTWLAVLVFGAGEAMTYRLQALNSGIPSQMILMIPYVLSILVVAFFGQKGSGPMCRKRRLTGRPHRRFTAAAAWTAWRRWASPAPMC